MNPTVVLLIDASIRASAVALFVGLVLAVSRSRGSGVRHSAWTFALASMLLMPGLVRVAPELPVALPSAAGLAVYPAAADDYTPQPFDRAESGATPARASVSAASPQPASPQLPPPVPRRFTMSGVALTLG